MLASRAGFATDSLSDSEVFVVATLQAGASSLRELASRLAMDEVALWRTIIGMRERGLLVTGDMTVSGADRSPNAGLLA